MAKKPNQPLPKEIPEPCVYYHRWNRAMRGAFLSGFWANRNGIPLDSNPYADKRNDRGCITWSRSFYRTWNDGWKYSDKHK